MQQSSVHNRAQNSSNNLHSHRTDNHHSSDVDYWSKVLCLNNNKTVDRI